MVSISSRDTDPNSEQRVRSADCRLPTSPHCVRSLNALFMTLSPPVPSVRRTRAQATTPSSLTTIGSGARLRFVPPRSRRSTRAVTWILVLWQQSVRAMPYTRKRITNIKPILPNHLRQRRLREENHGLMREIDRARPFNPRGGRIPFRTALQSISQRASSPTRHNGSSNPAGISCCLHRCCRPGRTILPLPG